MLNSGKNRQFFVLCDIEIWQMTFKSNRAPLLYATSSFVHRFTAISEIKLSGVTVRKRPIRLKIDEFMFHVTLKFERWPWKTIEDLFYATSSFVYHFVDISEFKLELQSGNAKFG